MLKLVNLPLIAPPPSPHLFEAQEFMTKFHVEMINDSSGIMCSIKCIPQQKCTLFHDVTTFEVHGLVSHITN